MTKQFHETISAKVWILNFNTRTINTGREEWLKAVSTN